MKEKTCPGFLVFLGIILVALVLSGYVFVKEKRRFLEMKKQQQYLKPQTQ